MGRSYSKSCLGRLYCLAFLTLAGLTVYRQKTIMDEAIRVNRQSRDHFEKLYEDALKEEYRWRQEVETSKKLANEATADLDRTKDSLEAAQQRITRFENDLTRMRSKLEENAKAMSVLREQHRLDESLSLGLKLRLEEEQKAAQAAKLQAATELRELLQGKESLEKKVEQLKISEGEAKRALDVAAKRALVPTLGAHGGRKEEGDHKQGFWERGQGEAAQGNGIQQLWNETVEEKSQVLEEMADKVEAEGREMEDRLLEQELNNSLTTEATK